MDLTALPWTWPGTDLPGYREYPEEHLTYAFFDYASLPPLPGPGHHFEWMSRLSVGESNVAEAGIPQTWGELAGAGVPAPDEFAQFMSTPQLQQRVRSCTGCWLSLAAFRTGDDWAILFLRDQQDSLLWLLHVPARGPERVLVCSDIPGWLEVGEPLVSSAPDPWPDVAICAASFREFIHRFALENALWNVLAGVEQRVLTDEERAYLQHYRPLG